MLLVYGFGMNILAHIKNSGKTVTQFCEEAGITRQTFYAAIKPGSNPKRKTLEAISSTSGLAMENIGSGLND